MQPLEGLTSNRPDPRSGRSVRHASSALPGRRGDQDRAAGQRRPDARAGHGPTRRPAARRSGRSTPARSRWSSTCDGQRPRPRCCAWPKAPTVFVENFRPGVARRLGLGPEDIRAVRPDIIYCSISGWGQSGPNSARGAYDHVIQAATGMMALQGSGTRPGAGQGRLSGHRHRHRHQRGGGDPGRTDPAAARRHRADHARRLDGRFGAGADVRAGGGDACQRQGAGPGRQSRLRRQSGGGDLRDRRRAHFGGRQHDGPVRDAVPAAGPTRTCGAALCSRRLAGRRVSCQCRDR